LPVVGSSSSAAPATSKTRIFFKGGSCAKNIGGPHVGGTPY
jgi:hypothetical protein